MVAAPIRRTAYRRLAPLEADPARVAGRAVAITGVSPELLWRRPGLPMEQVLAAVVTQAAVAAQASCFLARMRQVPWRGLETAPEPVR